MPNTYIRIAMHMTMASHLLFYSVATVKQHLVGKQCSDFTFHRPEDGALHVQVFRQISCIYASPLKQALARLGNAISTCLKVLFTCHGHGTWALSVKACNH